MSIKPDRFMNLDTCTLKVSGEIIKKLLSVKQLEYSTLFKALEKKYINDTEYIFPEALSFLYLLGKVEYDVDSDIVRLIL